MIVPKALALLACLALTSARTKPGIVFRDDPASSNTSVSTNASTQATPGVTNDTTASITSSTDASTQQSSNASSSNSDANTTQSSSTTSVSSSASNTTVGSDSGDMSTTMTNSTGPDLGSVLDTSSTMLNSPPDQDPSLTYISIVESTGNFALSYDENNNFLLVDQSKADSFPFGTAGGSVVLVGPGLLPVMYSNEMDALGVSRMRLQAEASVPVGAVSLSLAPAAGLLLPVDTRGNVYYTIACNVQDIGTKVFIAKDPVQGEQTLMDPILQTVITGGVVTSCFTVAFRTK